uniref:Uncharacterized protein n=1 Tax=Anguilla anguilla TaxID=7936 RepID=A0A0E9S579_ANGAN
MCGAQSHRLSITINFHLPTSTFQILQEVVQPLVANPAKIPSKCGAFN